MKKVMKILAVAIALAGCTISFPEPAVITTGPTAHIYDYCDPTDWNYLETEYDCDEAYYTIELCDPHNYYYRPGCWEYWEVSLEFSDCFETHYCF